VRHAKRPCRVLVLQPQERRIRATADRPGVDSEFKVADMPRSDDFARLESEVEKNPTPERARERLLEALSADPERFDDPRRFELIAWFLKHNPRHHICSTPFMSVNPETAPGAFQDLKARWLALVSKDPADPLLAREAAAFLATESLEEGKRLLQAAIAQRPADPKLWLDLGRMSEDPGERLKALEKALDAGETRPNLLVWIATTSFEAGDYEKAERTAGELIELVDEARTRFGDKLDWPERGNELWERARKFQLEDRGQVRNVKTTVPGPAINCESVTAGTFRSASCLQIRATERCEESSYAVCSCSSPPVRPLDRSRSICVSRRLVT
jgi:hypothetical protein